MKRSLRAAPKLSDRRQLPDRYSLPPQFSVLGHICSDTITTDGTYLRRIVYPSGHEAFQIDGRAVNRWTYRRAMAQR